MKIANHTEVYKKVAEELNIPIDTLYKIYRAYWKFIRNSIEKLPLKGEITENQFNELQTNFNIPSLGKLNCTFDKVIGLKRRLEYIKKLKNGIKN